MKKTIFFLIIMCFIISTKAQNDDKNRLGRYAVTQLPSNPLPSDYKTYKVLVSTSDLYLRDNIYANISLAGFNKLEKDDSKEGDFTIKIEPYPFKYSSAESTSNTTKSKNKDGVEVSTTTYGYKGSMTYKFNVKMVTKNDSVFFDKEYSGTTDLSSSGAKTSKEAYSSYESSANSAPGRIINEQFSSMSRTFNETYGFPVKTYFPDGYSVKVGKKCKFDYTDLTSAYDTMAVAFKIIVANENNIDEYMKKMETALAKWETALKESNIEDKKARINEELTCAIYHNLGLTYFMAKDYPKSIEYFTKCKELKKSYGDASSFMNVASNLQKRVDANSNSLPSSMINQ